MPKKGAQRLSDAKIVNTERICKYMVIVDCWGCNCVVWVIVVVLLIEGIKYYLTN